MIKLWRRLSLTVCAAALLLGGHAVAAAQGGAADQPGIASPQEAQMDAGQEAQARALLEQEGYEQIGELEREGERFTGKAQKDGRSVDVEVDPRRGEVTEKETGI